MPAVNEGETIRVATTTEAYRVFGDVATAYVGWCRERYLDEGWLGDRVFDRQVLAAELQDLSAAYAPTVSNSCGPTRAIA